MDPECGVRAGYRPAAGTAAGWHRRRAGLTYNTPKCVRSGASIPATAKRRPVREPCARQATAATLLRDGETSGTSNTS